MLLNKYLTWIKHILDRNLQFIQAASALIEVIYLAIGTVWEALQLNASHMIAIIYP